MPRAPGGRRVASGVPGAAEALPDRPRVDDDGLGRADHRGRGGRQGDPRRRAADARGGVRLAAPGPDDGRPGPAGRPAGVRRLARGDGVPGDLIEAGAWRGGSSILMRAALDSAEDPAERTVWVADSFEGFRAPEDEAEDRGGLNTQLSAFEILSVPLDEVAENFKRLGLEDGVRFVKGYFEETLPPLRGERQWALIRLDGDTYEATRTTLDALYEGPVPGRLRDRRRLRGRGPVREGGRRLPARARHRRPARDRRLDVRPLAARLRPRRRVQRRARRAARAPAGDRPSCATTAGPARPHDHRVRAAPRDRGARAQARARARAVRPRATTCSASSATPAPSGSPAACRGCATAAARRSAGRTSAAWSRTTAPRPDGARAGLQPRSISSIR